MKHTSNVPLRIAVLAFAVIAVIVLGPGRHAAFWRTPDQQGDRLMRQQKYEEAAKAYVDPVKRGVALYRASDFKAAAAAFATGSSADAAYNQANCLVMLGQYDLAIKRYDRALGLHPNWNLARQNRAIAIVRRDRVKATGGDESGGKIDPDKIVFDHNKSQQKQIVQVDAGPPLSDEQLQTMWLRRVQTKPADFLRAKFAFQNSQQTAGEP